ncbi:type II toxin-antitoxin system Phd/YefM family antitoxin [Patescibacteria group bacterium]|nr:type II toxin-antitoxin system Phd/YefM family antitoxin [Patescibacteria group bacterium]
MLNTTTYTASEARKNFYSLIKSASEGLKAFEINLRGTDPVILISKDELESWQETLDVLSSPEEVMAIEKARKEKRTISHSQLLKEIGLDGNKI